MEEDILAPGKHFPEDAVPPTREEVLGELEKYGYSCGGAIRLIDTSHGANDIRLNYVIGREYVLRMGVAPGMTEERMAELDRLIARYKEFGLKCPAFLTDAEGRFFHEFGGMQCYLAEYVDLPIMYEAGLSEEAADAVWREVLDSVALFAKRYKNVDLTENFGMYSLFDLSPFDREIGIDEKQQNFQRLCAELDRIGEIALRERLEKKHEDIRQKLLAVYKSLPRCVFQGDENSSNVLLGEDGHLAGFIDFNLAGTEVVVNQFANLGGGFDEEIKEPIGAEVRLSRALESYRRYQGRMLELYGPTDEERRALSWYSWIALTAGWPQYCFFSEGLKDEKLKPEILGLLGLLAELDDSALML